jgi:hypothetical protein
LTGDRRTRATAPRDDDWVLPAWNPEPAAETPRPTTRKSNIEALPELARPPQRLTRPHESGFVLGMAIAPGVVALLSIVVSFLPVLAGTGSVPRGLMLVIAAQAIAFGVLRAGEGHPLMRSWVSTLICSAVLLPLLALQVTLLREPYVALARQSAAPSMVATFIVTMVLFVGAVWTVATSWENPDEAGLLFMPQAMMVPAMIGMRSTILQGPALEMLGKILFLAAVATAVAWLLPQPSRLLVPPVTVAVEFVALWATGHGPWFHATSGDIVRVLYSVMLAVSVILVVMVPYTAAWVRHGAGIAMQSRPKPRRKASPQPAHRGPVVPR